MHKSYHERLSIRWSLVGQVQVLRERLESQGSSRHADVGELSVVCDRFVIFMPARVIVSCCSADGAGAGADAAFAAVLK